MSRSVFLPRPNTQDDFIIKEVFENNCYNLPHDMDGIVVLDIGANIGAFTGACIDRGVAYVISLEPEDANFHRLYRNCKQNGWDDCWLRKLAVTDYDGQTMLSEVVQIGDIKFTGGYTCIAANGKGYPVKCISILSLLEQIKDSPRIWIKLDCEGAEYSIVNKLSFAHPELLKRVERIFGEVHEIRDGKLSSVGPEISHLASLPTHGELVQSLETLGYNTSLYPNNTDSSLALFFAERK